ncbi:hypothetical protein GCM10010336_66610 [Streptomyces goshikiensis]|nr:hypothetical protein GCM10010336_66610 [Streptomyces goshikiensis]
MEEILRALDPEFLALWGWDWQRRSHTTTGPPREKASLLRRRSGSRADGFSAGGPITLVKVDGCWFGRLERCARAC